MVPSSKIYICAGVLLRSDQAHTIYFANETAQRNYFVGRASANVGGRTFTDYTLTRNNLAYVEASLDEAEYWNYAMIENTVEAGPVMRKYYFIEDVEYIDENTVGLHLKLDVMQTFQHQPAGGYNAVLPSCFVEREHSVYDGSRAFNGTSYNTLEEPIDTGEFVVRNGIDICDNDWSIVVSATIRLDLLTATSTTVTKSYGQSINNTWSGLGFYFAPASYGAQVLTIINNLSTIGYIDGIVDIYLFPTEFLVKYTQDTSTEESPFVRISHTVSTDNRIGIPSRIGSYTPKNKKLLQYPYTFFYLTDGSGLSAVYRPEYYGTPSSGYFVLDIAANPLSDAGILIYPSGYYKGVSGNKEEGIMINNYPRLPWTSDQYKLWLAQTANTRRYNLEQATFSHTYREQQIDKQIVGAMGSGIAGGLTAILTAGIGGWDQILGAADSMADAALSQWANDKTYDLARMNLEAQVKDHAITPPQSKGGCSGNLSKLTGLIRGKLQIKTVDDMHARIIDEYFDHYGYATNTFKVPNINSRPAWNFVKTAGFDVKLGIPQRYKVAISDVFNSGVTFWKDPAKIGDYTQNNAAQS